MDGGMDGVGGGGGGLGVHGGGVISSTKHKVEVDVQWKMDGCARRFQGCLRKSYSSPFASASNPTYLKNVQHNY